ncbi:polynucleotide adenylyltransferase PcnB, partial [Paraburkholderia sp. BR14261]
HQRFRAGYDFLLLRCESGELDAEVGQWWTDFISGDNAERETLLAQGGKERSPRKRRRRGGAKSRRTGEGAVSEAGAAGDVHEASSTDYDGHAGPHED